MGHFSTGAEGWSYEEEYCDRCIHQGAVYGPSCAVWLAHLQYNYQDCNDPESILHILIPLTKDGENKQCTMFVEKPDAH